jgi:hypothetical protein
MDKRIAKRHKRQVSRAKQKIQLSEPDLRTPEQIKAAREVSRVANGHGSDTRSAVTSFRNSRPAVKGGSAKTDV